jgi:hypothetical protein
MQMISSRARLVLAILAGIVILTTATVGAAVAAVYHAGTVAIDVSPAADSRISVALPAALLNLAITLVPAEVVSDVTEELEPVWPTVQAAARELHRAPDFVLLEIEGRDEHFLIEKRDGRMVMVVEDRGERISLAVPLSTIRRIADKLS